MQNALCIVAIIAQAWKDKHLKYLKEYGDITDMTACGYFLDSDYYDRFCSTKGLQY